MQAKTACEYAISNIELKNKSFIIVHSSLSRAINTAKITFPLYIDKFIQQSNLDEATHVEHVIPLTLHKRIKKIESWLCSQMDKDVIIIVGHGQYFKKMLGVKESFRNCDIVEVVAKVDISKQTVIWDTSRVKLLFRSNLSYQHPLNQLLGLFSGHNLGLNDRDGVVIDNEQVIDDCDDESIPTCRICQVIL
jgi:hypothetical protein